MICHIRILLGTLFSAIFILTPAQPHPPGVTPGCPTDEYSTVECDVYRLVFENTGLNANGKDIKADEKSLSDLNRINLIQIFYQVE